MRTCAQYVVRVSQAPPSCIGWNPRRVDRIMRKIRILSTARSREFSRPSQSTENAKSIGDPGVHEKPSNVVGSGGGLYPDDSLRLPPLLRVSQRALLPLCVRHVSLSQVPRPLDGREGG